jgi:hypothetical protein
MPDVDPTPDTPVTIGDRLGWWRGDLDTKLDTIVTKLDGILTALTTANGNIDAAPIVTAIQALAGPAPGKTITDLYALFSYGSGIRPYNLLDNQYLKLIDIVDLLTKSNAALGAVPYNSLELASVRGLLSSLLFATQQIGILPDGNVSSYPQSDTTLTLGGRRYVVWPALVGITESTDMTELTPATSWSGYSIYIQTSAPSAKLHDITTPAASIDAIAVNSWVDLGGSDTLAFSVDASYVVKGYLRAPSVPPSTNSYTIASATIVANGYSFSAIVWPAEFDAVITRGVFVTGDSRWILLGNYQNWTFKTIPGVQYMRDSDGVDIATHDLGTGWGIIDAVTTSVTFSMGGGNTNPFVLTFNRPA